MSIFLFDLWNSVKLYDKLQSAHICVRIFRCNFRDTASLNRIPHISTKLFPPRSHDRYQLRQERKVPHPRKNNKEAEIKVIELHLYLTVQSSKTFSLAAYSRNRNIYTSQNILHHAKAKNCWKNTRYNEYYSETHSACRICLIFWLFKNKLRKFQVSPLRFSFFVSRDFFRAVSLFRDSRTERLILHLTRYPREESMCRLHMLEFLDQLVYGSSCLWLFPDHLGVMAAGIAGAYMHTERLQFALPASPYASTVRVSPQWNSWSS